MTYIAELCYNSFSFTRPRVKDLTFYKLTKEVFPYFIASTVFFDKYQKSHNTEYVLQIIWNTKFKVHNPVEDFFLEKACHL